MLGVRTRLCSDRDEFRGKKIFDKAYRGGNVVVNNGNSTFFSLPDSDWTLSQCQIGFCTFAITVTRLEAREYVRLK